MRPDVDGLVRLLTDEARAVSPMLFPADREGAQRPGLYSWWSDPPGRSLLGAEIGADLPPLLYVGQAGATRWPSGSASRATLLSRILRQHIRGDARSSTFRLTISSLLMSPLRLEPDGRGRLLGDSNRRVSEWIAEHMSVAIAPFSERDDLAAIEGAVVRRLDPPLNLGHCVPSQARARLTDLRATLRRLA